MDVNTPLLARLEKILEARRAEERSSGSADPPRNEESLPSTETVGAQPPKDKLDNAESEYGTGTRPSYEDGCDDVMTSETCKDVTQDLPVTCQSASGNIESTDAVNCDRQGQQDSVCTKGVSDVQTVSAGRSDSPEHCEHGEADSGVADMESQSQSSSSQEGLTKFVVASERSSSMLAEVEIGRQSGSHSQGIVREVTEKIEDLVHRLQALVKIEHYTKEHAASLNKIR